MTWQEALEIVVARTGHARYRELTSADFPDEFGRNEYRRMVTEMAVNAPVTPTSYPPVATMIGSLWREMLAFVRSGGQLASKEERARRRAICEVCSFWNAAARRCTQCGCKGDIKVYSLVAKCPDDPPRW